MNWTFRALSLAAAALLAAPARADDAKKDDPAAANAPISYYKQVRPIFQRRCQGCHQPAKKDGKLDITGYEGAVAGGSHGAGIVPGDPGESLVLLHVTGEEKPRMPKGEDPLPEDQIELIRRWIAEGARDDTPESAKRRLKPGEPFVYDVPPVISAIEFSPDGELLAVNGYREVALHKADGSALAARLIGISDRIESIDFSADGKRLAAVGGSPGRFGEVQIWNVAEKKLEQSAMVGFDSLYGAAFSDDGSRIAFGSSDNSAQVYSVPELQRVLRVDHHTDWCFGARFSADGSHLVSVSRDRHMKLTVVENGQFIDNITSITPGVLGGGLQCIARHPKEDKFLTGGEDGVARMYKMVRTTARRIGDDDNLLRAFEKIPGTVNSVAFDAGGERIAAATSLGEARIFAAADGKRISALEKQPEAIFTIAFHPGGKTIATGGKDGKVRLYEVESGKLLREFIPVPIGPQRPARRF